MGEDVFRDGLLIRKTLEQNDHLRLTDGMHPLGRQIPALPVYICGLGEQKTSQSYQTNMETVTKLQQSHKLNINSFIWNNKKDEPTFSTFTQRAKIILINHKTLNESDYFPSRQMVCPTPTAILRPAASILNFHT